MAVTDLSELAEAIETEVRETLRLPALDALRSIAIEAGIRRARATLREAPDLVANAKDHFRIAQKAEQVAKEAFDSALLEAEWELDDRFAVIANKTYLMPEDFAGFPAVSGDVKIEPGPEAKAMTADERSKWKTQQARKLPAVARVAKLLRETEEATARARDDIDTAENRLMAAKYELIAAGIELQTLAIGLQAREL